MPYRSTFVYIKHLHAPDPFVLGPVQTQAGLHKMYSLTSPLKDSLVSVTLGEKKKGGGEAIKASKRHLLHSLVLSFVLLVWLVV